MFKDNLFLHSYQYSIRDKAVNALINRIEKRCDMSKIMKGISTAYLVLPDDDINSYTEEEKKTLSKVLNRALEANEITSKLINSVIFVVEYSNSKKAVLNYFPIDRSIVDNIDEISGQLKDNKVIQLTL